MTNIKIPGPQMGLNQIVDAFTLSISEEEAKTMKWNPLRPSSAGKCARELAFEYAQYKGYVPVERQVIEPALARIFSLGHSIEWHVIDHMKRAFNKMDKPIQIKYKQQVVDICQLHDGRDIEGSIDLWLESPDWKCLADVKSKGEKYSSYYKSSWEEFLQKILSTGYAVSIGPDAAYITDLEKFIVAHNDPWFAKNLYQLNLYACSDFATKRGLDFCSILQYGKSTSRLREIRFSPTPAVADNRREMFKLVAKTVDETKDPMQVQKSYVLGSSACGFCDHRAKCWPTDDAKKAHFKTWPYKAWPKDLDRLDQSVQVELINLFRKYTESSKHAEDQSIYEESILKVLDREGINKIRLNEHQIYEVKHLKSGGKGGKGQVVLRRGKV
jgi:hypothetical protein